MMLDRDKYLSEDEARRLMEYAESKHLYDLQKGRSYYVRSWMVIHFLLGTGCRASECRLAKIKDLNLKGREPSVTLFGKRSKKSKKPKKRTVEISPKLKKHLQSFLKWKGIVGEPVGLNDYLFTNRLKKPWSLMGIQNVFKRMAKEAGLREVYSIHSTRHCYGFMMFKKTKNIRLCQNLLGHASLASTQVYAHVCPDEKRKAVNNLWN
ncbi:tyrosine-type recombinase/integrase [Thermodesulfobacteriota bacterium]